MCINISTKQVCTLKKPKQKTSTQIALDEIPRYNSHDPSVHKCRFYPKSNFNCGFSFHIFLVGFIMSYVIIVRDLRRSSENKN
jgi:hypothetical protein